MSTPPSTPPNPTLPPFDITEHYRNLLTSDKSLTPPIAAIESLISLLSASPITTVSETLSLISHASSTLLSSQANPIPVSAGTDLFQRYLITSFQNTPLPSQSGNDFTQLRKQLITNSKVFVARAKSARHKIARHALPLIRDESVVITYGSSRVVQDLLVHAADAGRWFRVVQVVPSSSVASLATKGAAGEKIAAQVAGLRKAGIEVAVVTIASLSYALHSLPTSGAAGGKMLILGTSAVLENGATVSEMGCYLVSQVAQVHEVPLYVATESYKFARQFPVGYGSKDLEKMGTKQEVLKFSASTSAAVPEVKKDEKKIVEEQLVDITPPGLISGLITENGMMTPNAVAEELIKLWF